MARAGRQAAMIETIGLTKRYKSGVLALDGLDLRVGEGEIYGLLGANGAGKTTTIHLFLNFIEPTRGRALICGYDAVEESIEARRHAAYVSENVALYGSLTARQNLDFFARIGGGREHDGRSLDLILEQVGLPAGARERRLCEFSKGMRQKLGIAIAIAKDAPAILLDDPTSGLDPKAGAEFLEILMSTHDIFRAREISDRVGIMKSGRLLAELDRREMESVYLQKLYIEFMQEGGLPSPDGDCEDLVPAGDSEAGSDREVSA